MKYFRIEMHLLQDFRSKSFQESVDGDVIYVDHDGEVDQSTVTSSHQDNNSNDLTSILKSHRRKRRLADNIDDGDEDKGMTPFLASVSILKSPLLPSKRRRRPTELRDVKHDDLFLEDPADCQKHVFKAKIDTEKPRKQKTVKQITKEDIFAFIHNIRLEGTRAEELANLMAAKCFLATD